MELSPTLKSALVSKYLLIFDFDGTLADTSPLHQQAFSEVLSPLGLHTDYESIAGLSTADAILQVFNSEGLATPSPSLLNRLKAQKQARVRHLITHKLDPLPQVSSFLLWARPRFRMAIVTSGSRGTVQLALQKLGYLDLFDLVICSEDTASSKPNPEGLLKALHFFNCQPYDALVFEDSKAGFQAALNASIDFFDILRNPLYI